MATRPVILVLMHLLLLAGASLQNYKENELDEELDILREEDLTLKLPGGSTSGNDDDDSDFDDDSANFRGSGNSSEDVDEGMPNIDDKDVVVLRDRNFVTVIESNEFVMVEFYAPWCALCRELAPEYAAAASELREENVVLAKVDAMEESELAHEFDVQGFPTFLFFVDGVSRIYKGQRTKDAIVTWIKKNTGPGVTNITTLDEAERILTSHNIIALAFLNSLAGPESREVAAASKLDDDVRFYQTVNGDIADVFRIGPIVKRPALVLLKKEVEKLSHFSGNFVRSEIADFVLANKLPLVITFTRDLAPSIFESRIKKQLLLFVNSTTSDEIFLTFQDAAKLFKGKIIFIHIRTDDNESGKPVADHFGITETSSKILAFTGNEDSRKFFFDGEINLESVKGFAEDFLEDRLKPFYSSAQVPETNDGDVKIVVGNNFDEIVLDESKDVLLEIYAPWCGHCQALEPIYDRLAKHLRGVRSIVIAKMDATTNEHPRAKPDGYPTILFFPARNKSFDPVTVEVDRTVVEFYKFLKKHATIPFRLQRPRPSSAGEVVEHSPTDLKDEL